MSDEYAFIIHCDEWAGVLDRLAKAEQRIRELEERSEVCPKGEVVQ